MARKFCILMIIAMLCGSRSYALNGGHKFLFAFPEREKDGVGGNTYIQAFVSATETTNIYIEAPSINMHSNMTIRQGTTVVPFNENIEMSTTGKVEQKGIYISSDKLVTIYVVNHVGATSDGSLVLPYTPESTKFFVSSYHPLTASEFVIAAASDKTDVSITFNMKDGSVVNVNGQSYHNGQTLRITLNRLSTLQIKHNTDLTGTYITSTRPIAVTSGNKCANVPAGNSACDYLIEQMPPRNSWKSKYIVASFRSESYLRFRIMSSENNNRITISGDIHQTFDLSKGDFKEMHWNQNYIVLIEATHGVLVTQYNEGQSGYSNSGDPFMVTIPSFDHFADEYLFRSPTGFDSHHGSVIIQTSLVNGLHLDGHALIKSEEKQISIVLSGISRSYSVVKVDISSGDHHLTHIRPDVTFGMLLYGFGDDDSYGLSLCWNMNGTMINGVRLTNSTSSKSGIVEMLIDGVWAPVCYGGLDRTTARVICRTLGYDKYGLSPQSISTTTYPGKSSTVVTPSVSCSGHETSITGCRATYAHSNGCHGNVTHIDCAPSLEEIVQVSCTPTSWKVTVDMDKLQYRFPGSVDSDIYLGKNTCTGTLVGHDLVFNDDIHSCLTSKSETSQDIVFSNQLVYAYHDPTYTFIIRSFNWTMDLRCHIPRDQSIHSNITYNETANQITTVINSTNQYAINTQFYLDPNFSQKLPGNPINQPTGTNVFVKSFVSNVDWNMKMRLNTCYTMSHGVQYYLIKNGCEVDANTHILSQTDHETKFVFQIFEVTGRQDDIYIKCDATMCDTSDPASIQQCDQNCRP